MVLEAFWRFDEGVAADGGCGTVIKGERLGGSALWGNSGLLQVSREGREGK